ncbi:hypothetical protein Emag_000076 [Eimeria magna]
MHHQRETASLLFSHASDKQETIIRSPEKTCTSCCCCGPIDALQQQQQQQELRRPCHRLLRKLTAAGEVAAGAAAGEVAAGAAAAQSLSYRSSSTFFPANAFLLSGLLILALSLDQSVFLPAARPDFVFLSLLLT